MNLGFFHLLIMMSVLICPISYAKKKEAEPIEPIPTKMKLDKKKGDLGKMLFFEPRLSKSGRISCNSCHNLATGGDDNMKTSIGHGWQLGPINSPTVFNSSFNFVQFWDGRAKDLKEQAAGPVENPKEMGFSHDLAVKTISSMPEYVALFKKAGYKEVSIDSITDSIAEFEKSLFTPHSKFDKWLRGDKKALTKMELEGYELFKAQKCSRCHYGVGVGGQSFEMIGEANEYHDKTTLGRFDVTKNEEDKYMFKVPLLRNIELTAPYFHDGYTYDLKEAVQMMSHLQNDKKLTDDEANKIVAFLKTLTGEIPKIEYPILPVETPETPRPVMN